MTIKDYHKAAIITPDHEVSYTELMQYIRDYADVLKQSLPAAPGASGEKKKVLIFSENREEWVYAFFSIWLCDAVAITVDATATVSDVAYIMRDSKADAIWVSPGTEAVARQALSETGQQMKVMDILLKDNVSNSSSLTAHPSSEMTFEGPADEMALIIYTSGTTGSPKGVMLSYENMEANIRGVADEVPIFNEERRTLMLLPVHHVLPLMGSVVAPITRGGGIAISPTMTGPDIMKTLCKGQVAIFIGVPRLWQTLYTGIKKKIDEKWITRALFNLCARVQSRALSRFIFKSVRDKMGGHLDYCVSGGAALDREIGNGLKTLGLDVLEGYGMTETAPIIAFTRPGDYIPGCSGKPLPSVEVKLVDGELCAKGKNLMLGYYNRPEETAQVIDKDGFLHTGDLATIDSEGRVTITGRTKEIIVLSNGKNVQPNEIEFQLEKYDECVKEAAVTEDNDQLVAIIVPQEQWAQGKSTADMEQLLKESVIRPYNRTVENYKKVMRIVVFQGELPRTKLDKLQRFKLKDIVKQPPSGLPQGGGVPNEGMLKEGLIANDGSHPLPQGGGQEGASPIAAAITAYIAAEKKCPVRLTDHIETDLALDSLDKVSLQSYIEDNFGVSINADDMADFSNIGEMCEHIEKAPAVSSKENQSLLISSSKGEAGRELLPTTHGIHAFMHSVYARLFRYYFRSNNRLTIRGMENIPASGPVIIAPNHQSYFDGALVVCGLSWRGVRDCYFYATEEHVKSSSRRWMASRHNVIIMERRNLKASIEQMGEVLRAGKRLVIFPEGSRTHDGSLGEFKKTFAILSIEQNVPIVPVCIKGAYEAMPRGRVLPTPHHITVEYLPSVMATGSAADPEALAADVQHRILACLNKN
ncbi:MAG: AMP-binding protein [Prevotella sp.]|nr:AMP-binding protein [Prevotella sp.]